MPTPDTGLRRLVVDLAAMHGDDQETILKRLPADHRSRVEALLSDFKGFGFTSPTVPLSGREVRRDLSSWLLQLIEGAECPEGMTKAAWELLRNCATRDALLSEPSSMAAAIGRAP